MQRHTGIHRAITVMPHTMASATTTGRTAITVTGLILIITASGRDTRAGAAAMAGAVIGVVEATGVAAMADGAEDKDYTLPRILPRHG